MILKVIEENFIKVIEKFVEIVKIPCVTMRSALDLDLSFIDCELANCKCVARRPLVTSVLILILPHHQ